MAPGVVSAILEGTLRCEGAKRNPSASQLTRRAKWQNRTSQSIDFTDTRTIVFGLHSTCLNSLISGRRLQG